MVFQSAVVPVRAEYTALGMDTARTAEQLYPAYRRDDAAAHPAFGAGYGGRQLSLLTYGGWPGA